DAGAETGPFEPPAARFKKVVEEFVEEWVMETGKGTALSLDDLFRGDVDDRGTQLFYCRNHRRAPDRVGVGRTLVRQCQHQQKDKCPTKAHALSQLQERRRQVKCADGDVASGGGGRWSAAAPSARRSPLGSRSADVQDPPRRPVPSRHRRAE